MYNVLVNGKIVQKEVLDDGDYYEFRGRSWKHYYTPTPILPPPEADYLVTWLKVESDNAPDSAVLSAANASAVNGIIDKGDYLLVVVKSGSVVSNLNRIKFTVDNTGPAGDYVIPIKHVRSNSDFTEVGPRLAMAVTKTSAVNMTPTAIFPTAGFYVVDADALNAKYPNAYACKTLVIEVSV